MNVIYGVMKLQSCDYDGNLEIFIQNIKVIKCNFNLYILEIKSDHNIVLGCEMKERIPFI